MKLSFALSLQKTKFRAIAQEHFEDSLKLLGNLGYEGVEIGIRDPDKVDISKLSENLKSYKIRLIAIGTGQAFVDDGLSLIEKNEGIRKKTIERMIKQIDIAQIFECQVIIGLIRGNLDEGIRDKQMAWLKEGIRILCKYANEKNVDITIEPVNRYESNYLNNAFETVKFIEEIDMPNLKMLLDTFHMNIEEKNILSTVKNSIGYLSHVHIADSNRRYPGEGHIDFEAIYQELENSGYDKYLSGEMLPVPNIETAISKYHQFMKGLLK